MNSFDVFDTILARRFIKNDYLLSMLEQTYNIPNFCAERKVSDNGRRNFDEIYSDLVDRKIIPENLCLEIKNHELQLEREHSFLILENYQKIQEGDILISDMYLSGPDILDWLRSLGMNKQVTIYQSNGDKSSGVVWQKIKNSKLEYHLGDNQHSDFTVPSSIGINCILYTNAINSTSRESILNKQGLSFISNLIREIRLTNVNLIPESYEVNVPWLFIVCELLHRSYKKEKLAFLGRDCQLLYKIYNAYYDFCYYVPFSRKAAYTSIIESVEYLKTQVPLGVRLVDIASTGKTWQVVCKQYPFNMTAIFYTSEYSYAEETPKIAETFTYLANVRERFEVGLSLSIEYFNCGDHGYLSAVKSHNGIMFAEFGDKSFSDELIDVIQKPAVCAANLNKQYKTIIRNQLSSMSDNQINELFTEYSKEMLKLNIENMPEYNSYDAKENQYLIAVKSHVKNC